jgi:hypothetical protein
MKCHQCQSELILKAGKWFEDDIYDLGTCNKLECPNYGLLQVDIDE